MTTFVKRLHRVVDEYNLTSDQKTALLKKVVRNSRQVSAYLSERQLAANSDNIDSAFQALGTQALEELAAEVASTELRVAAPAESRPMFTPALARVAVANGELSRSDVQVASPLYQPRFVRAEEDDDRSMPARRGRFGRAKVCAFCRNGTASSLSYKNVDVLQNFTTERGAIRPRRRTGTCARHQRKLAAAIKRARHLALLPFTNGRK